jgi:hypothetical protein
MSMPIHRAAVMAAGKASAANEHPRAEAAGTPVAVPMMHGQGDGGGACTAMGGQHCSTAYLTTVNIAPPLACSGVRIAPPTPIADEVLPARSIGRAPPDLSVLSSLRM